MLDPTQESLLRAMNELESVAKRPDVKSADVLELAMERAGVLTASRWLVLHTEVDPPPDAVIAQYHAALVALVHEADPARRLVVGQGDFGEADGSEPAANPLFTYCRLTDLGRASITLPAVNTNAISLSYGALLRVEGAAFIHDELTRRFGTPDQCINQPPGNRGSLWAIKSRVSAALDINVHLAWLAELVERNSDFFRELVVSGVSVTLRLECNTNLDYALIGFDAFLLKAFVSTGIAIEFYAGLDPGPPCSPQPRWG